MRNTKLFFSLSIAAIILLSSVVSVSAKSIDDVSAIPFDSFKSITPNNSTIYGGIELERDEFDRIFESDEPIYLGNGLWAEELSYDEMVQKIAKNRNIPTTKTLSTKSAEEHTYYVHFYQQFEVGDTGWYPQLDIYVKCQGIYRDFVGIEDLNLIRSYNYISKVETNKKIYWVINGDFYNNGTTSTSFGGSVGIGDYAELNFTIQSQNNHFGYVYKTGYIQNR
ncbi:hypothetical protein [Paenibacillus lentus]|uniref:Uncharacterized protein n=1 Tax=Paenibacillus lentus TaxID=1338368 RepID=A0A3Q8S3V5_9BACL|nr:hypothetical protein [Paenibacillus lentus]AZK45481.1 hypothetical protein EIM92_04120 [Paenibacillus lentus]